MAGEVYILMGVSGSGKTEVGSRLADIFSAKFIDGDDLHPASNIDKMGQGIALGDDDRAPWLERLSDVCYSLFRKNETGFIACSSLKKKYRDHLRNSRPNVYFLWLDGTYETISSRLSNRKSHFMPADLLKSQFAALETPKSDEINIIKIDIGQDVNNVVRQCEIAVKYTRMHAKIK